MMNLQRILTLFILCLLALSVRAAGGYAETGKIPTGFKESAGIATDSAGNLYIAGDTAVHIYNKDGKRTATIALDRKPTCIATDGKAIYLGFIDHVEVYNLKGARQARWPSPGKNTYITSIAVGKVDVWVADAGNRVLLRCSRVGKVTARLGKKDAARGIPGLVAPSPHLDVAVAPDGRVWLANPGRHQFEAYSRDGKLLAKWGKVSAKVDGFIGCCNPTDFALLPGGDFITAEKGLQRVKIYRADGTFVALVAGPDAFPKRVFALDVATDARGRILVLDPSMNAVRVFTRTAEKIHEKR